MLHLSLHFSVCATRLHLNTTSAPSRRHPVTAVHILTIHHTASSSDRASPTPNSIDNAELRELSPITFIEVLV